MCGVCDEYINDTFCPDTFGSKSIVNLIALTTRNLMKINNLIFTIKKVSNLMNFKLYILKANVFSKDEDIKKVRSKLTDLLCFSTIF